ncbi:myosin regulatory light chain 2, atrial isoform [Falco biarmicus]|uniref:myosin regulatory light chain 2, atrial isoform n=1 Tax=Falco rusticolus TaxID=120794 RepID=UPI0018868599|nr:myosin regulatory light chain 2, atrial isoform [Falco rusticolus]XP_055552371.1 myosin regulatory light chain 2, atrial isoform [Falco cherrug]XP_056177728.1 myosin regulatory light chain 2, atrial isoform [Falco biarmicus]
MLQQPQTQGFKVQGGSGVGREGLGLGPLPALLQAFSCIDQNWDGIITQADLKENCLQPGTCHSPLGATHLQLEQMFAVTPTDILGNIDYNSLCYIVTHGDEED